MGIDIAPPGSEKEKDAAISEALKDIEKAHGKGSLIKMSDAVGRDTPHVSTGLHALDYKVLGIGGLPKGRIIESMGAESGGKTSVALAAIASVQSAGGRAAFIDAEHALDPNWATLLGVNMDELLVSQPDYGEQALQIVERLVRTKALDLIVVDSVAALTPKAELDGEIGDAMMGVQARMMGQAMRKLAGITSEAGAVLLFINQVREKLGVVYGNPNVTPGGRALKFYASVRLEISRKEAIKEGDVIVGNRIRIKAIKNKCAAPFKEAEVDLYFASGFDKVGPLLDLATGLGIVEKSGSWYSYNGQRMGQGKAQALAYLTENNLVETLLKQVEEKQK